MRRLREMRESGTTILFVSHAINSIRELCVRAILLDHGVLVAEGPPAEVAHRYVELAAKQQQNHAVSEALELGLEPVRRPDDYGLKKEASLIDRRKGAFLGRERFERYAAENRTGNGKAQFLNVSLLNTSGEAATAFCFGEEVLCRMVIRINYELSNLWVGYKVRTVTGVDIIHADSSLCNQLSYPYAKGCVYLLDWRFKMNLMHGAYTLGCAIGLPTPPTGLERVMEYVDVVNIAQTFTVCPRSEGMIGGTAVWDNALYIEEMV
jgi:lipopolysaccharide transport system ATP-binding protein